MKQEQTHVDEHDVSESFLQNVETYVSLLRETMIKGAAEHGLSEDTAKHLVFQTLLGAAEM
ncbi:pyrroline-5-carboxylate reductase dimerization domain-containing protein, partial [Acinetobacter baumannii]|uniref:pyrroline-5-carboxylate reductase dimerization domain-containing protein n=1 Tax=Acinetobacter baumannii TaxID=470 RepID=UPI00196A07F9